MSIPKRRKEYQRQYYKKKYIDRKINGLCVVCGINLLIKNKLKCEECTKIIAKRSKVYRDAWDVETRNRIKESNNRNRQRYKTIVFEYYGNKCACCGETNRKFLTIDHINNNGNIHRKEHKNQFGGFKIAKWIVDNDFPPGFQILCWNCNCGKRMNNGICPHKEKEVV